jgi:hypothetical protein
MAVNLFCVTVRSCNACSQSCAHRERLTSDGVLPSVLLDLMLFSSLSLV